MKEFSFIFFITFILFPIMMFFSCSKNSKELRVARGAGQGVYYSLFVRSFEVLSVSIVNRHKLNLRDA